MQVRNQASGASRLKFQLKLDKTGGFSSPSLPRKTGPNRAAKSMSVEPKRLEAGGCHRRSSETSRLVTLPAGQFHSSGILETSKYEARHGATGNVKTEIAAADGTSRR